MTPHNGVETQWDVHGLRLAGLSWGSPEARPLLCLHGWLDNAASFAVLAPLLQGSHVVAPDLTGHGKSARRSADATYQIWDDLPEVLGVVEALGWQRFDLIGHSRGAVIASLFAATFPERVSHLVLLDAVGPEPVPESEFPVQMRRFLQDKGRLLEKDNRVFASVEEAVASRSESGMPASAARMLAERNLRPCEGGVTWTTDPRLRGASAVKLTEGQVQAVLQGLDMPTLLLLAEGGLGGRHPELAATAERSIRQLEIERVAGGHHFHMETPLDSVAERIGGFLAL
jgi:pimeloyl-ACP methyl ester carboxylesterase